MTTIDISLYFKLPTATDQNPNSTPRTIMKSTMVMSLATERMETITIIRGGIILDSNRKVGRGTITEIALLKMKEHS